MEAGPAKLPLLFWIYVAASFIIAAALAPPAWSAGAISPIEYPDRSIGNTRPPFIWQDLYNERDRRYNVKYRLTVKEKKEASSRSWLFMPALHHATYYTFTAPEPLGKGEYLYTIERLVDGQAAGSRFYHYRRYPLRGEFALDPAVKKNFEALHTEDLIRYLTLERDNRVDNGYNSLFFAGSGTISLGVGILFYRYFDLGAVSTVISALCFTSAAIGYGASGYYGYRYFRGRGELQRIVRDGETALLPAPGEEKIFRAGLDLKF